MRGTTSSHRLQRRLTALISLGGVLVLAGGGGLAALESNVVSSYGEGVWWALSLMTTVGFVGEAPETTGGRVVSALLMLAGFAMMALTTAAIASILVREEEEPQREVERDFETSARYLLADIAERLTALEAALDTGPRTGPRTGPGTTPRPGDPEPDHL
ncbi:MAG: potassium channel family protein [Nocardioides sp.]